MLITSIKDSTYTLKFKSQANNITKLTVTRNPQKDSNTVYKSFVSVPELNNCKFTNEIRIENAVVAIRIKTTGRTKTRSVGAK